MLKERSTLPKFDEFVFPLREKIFSPGLRLELWTIDKIRADLALNLKNLSANIVARVAQKLDPILLSQSM